MSRPVVALAVIALLAGCDSVFGLEHASFTPRDAAPMVEVDTDADGTADLADNCPLVANADQANGDSDEAGDACDLCPAVLDDQHDEDADGIGDRCDNCPHEVNETQANGDGDQIGDACDGWPAELDCISRFDGFATYRALMPYRGTWVVEGDQLVQTDAEATHALLLTSEVYTNPRVEMAATVVAFGSPSSHNVGVWGGATINGTNMLPDGYTAEVLDNSSFNATLAVSKVTDGVASAMSAFPELTPVTNLIAGSTVRVVFDLRTAPDWVAQGIVGGSQRVANSNNADSNVRQVGVRVHGTIVRFDWLWILTRANGGCPPRN